MTLIELVSVHHASRMKVLRGGLEELADADAFLRAGLGSYEISERDVWEAQRILGLERERIEVLGRLNEAHRAVMAVPMLPARRREGCDRAMALLGGSKVRLELGSSGRGRRTVVERGSQAPEIHAEPVRVAVPTRMGMGVLDVWPRPGAQFGEADRAVLRQFALLATGAIDDANRFE